MKKHLTPQTFNWLFGSMVCTAAIVSLAFAIVMTITQMLIPALLEVVNNVRFF